MSNFPECRGHSQKLSDIYKSAVELSTQSALRDFGCSKICDFPK
jgi:hypothetical protein